MLREQEELKRDFSHNEALLTKRGLAIEHFEEQEARYQKETAEREHFVKTLQDELHSKETEVNTLRGTLNHRDHLVKTLQTFQTVTSFILQIM